MCRYIYGQAHRFKKISCLEQVLLNDQDGARGVICPDKPNVGA